MATTPSFNWPTPDNTGLVKNGALDIRTLGNSIDSSMTDLKGGTTGQILAKATDTDMDFAWITNDVGDITAVTAGTGISGGGTSGAVTITNSMATEITAKGDLIVGTGSATFDNLAAGSNGDTLVADSSTSTGLRYTAGTTTGNPVLNSAYQVWQRGTSVSVAASTSNAYTADRWAVVTGANQAFTVSRQATGDTTNLPSIQYNGRFQRNSGQTGTTAFYLSNAFETINSIPFVGKTVTVSFYARAGANYSSASNALSFILYSGTGTDEQSNTGYTGATSVASTTATLTTTWQRFTATGTIGTSANEISLQFSYTPVGTAGANDYFDLTGVQLDVGSVALPFRTYAATIQQELAACQRYYYLHASGNSKMVGNGAYYSASEVDCMIQFPVTMRTAPTIDQITGTDYYTFYRNGGADGFNSFTISYASTTGTNLFNASQVSGTAGQAGQIATNNASAYLGFAAEL
jgi:hypothetical protein